jgi:hypothetical protein
MTQGWIQGMDNIVEWCVENLGFHSKQSVRRWRKKYNLPVHYLPGGAPFIIPEEVFKWAIEYDRRKEQKRSPVDTPLIPI